jgi:hypothetical protein
VPLNSSFRRHKQSSEDLHQSANTPHDSLARTATALNKYMKGSESHNGKDAAPPRSDDTYGHRGQTTTNNRNNDYSTGQSTAGHFTWESGSFKSPEGELVDQRRDHVGRSEDHVSKTSQPKYRIPVPISKIINDNNINNTATNDSPSPQVNDEERERKRTQLLDKIVLTTKMLHISSTIRSLSSTTRRSIQHVHGNVLPITVTDPFKLTTNILPVHGNVEIPLPISPPDNFKLFCDSNSIPYSSNKQCQQIEIEQCNTIQLKL